MYTCANQRAVLLAYCQPLRSATRARSLCCSPGLAVPDYFQTLPPQGVDIDMVSLILR